MKFIKAEKRLVYNVDEVLFIDTERKMLPFRKASQAKVKTASTWEQFEALMRVGCGITDVSKDKEKSEYYDPVKVVIIDSFTRVLYLLSQYLERKMSTGFTFWKDYADMIEKLLMSWSSKGRFIVFTALDEVVRDTDSIDRIVVKIDGKKLEGKIESYFSIVLHTRYNSVKSGSEAYQFCTNTDGKNTAKSPEGMFPDRYIQNDLSFVLGSIYDYYDMENNPDFMPSPIIICGKSGTGKSTSSKYLFEGGE